MKNGMLCTMRSVGAFGLWLTVLMMTSGCSGPVKDDGRGTRLVGQSPLEYELAAHSKKKKTPRARRDESLSLPSLNMTRGSGPPIPDVDTDERARQVVDFLAGRKGDPNVFFIPFRYYRMLHPSHGHAVLRRLHERKNHKYINKINKLRRSGRYSGAIYLSFVLEKCRYLTEGSASRYECSAHLELEREGERMHIAFRRVLNWGRQWYVLDP